MFTMQTYINKPNGDVPFTVENEWNFEFLLWTRCAHEKESWSIAFFIKSGFIVFAVLKLVSMIMKIKWLDHLEIKCDKSKYLTNSVKNKF